MRKMIRITEKDACRSVAQAIRDLRGGNRMTVNNDVSLTMTLYRKDEPDKQCGTAKLNGSFAFTLLDAALAAGIAAVILSISGAVRALFRHF